MCLTKKNYGNIERLFQAYCIIRKAGNKKELVKASIGYAITFEE